PAGKVKLQGIKVVGKIDLDKKPKKEEKKEIEKPAEPIAEKVEEAPAPEPVEEKVEEKIEETPVQEELTVAETPPIQEVEEIAPKEQEPELINAKADQLKGLTVLGKI